MLYYILLIFLIYVLFRPKKNIKYKNKDKINIFQSSYEIIKHLFL